MTATGQKNGSDRNDMMESGTIGGCFPNLLLVLPVLLPLPHFALCLQILARLLLPHPPA